MTRRKLGLRLLLAAGAALLTFGAADLLVRLLVPAEPAALWFEDAERTRVTGSPVGWLAERGFVEPQGLPRGRPRFLKPTTWYVCYPGGDRPSMDERGCVRVDINRHGLRDRADLEAEKPPGRRRVLCLGDSFTFGYGVAAEATWVRLIEPALAARGDVRTINCGLASGLLIDEHWWSLRDRFAVFEPDAVVLSICLNDLVPLPHTVALFREVIPSDDYLVEPKPRSSSDFHESVRLDPPFRLPLLGWSRIGQLIASSVQNERRTKLDPRYDWGRWLLEAPPAATDPAEAAYWARVHAAQGIPADATWAAGAPQTAMREMRDWCRARGAPLVVVVWPLFQGLAADAHYPFETLHRVVREFCTAEGIPVLDLLPRFRGRPAASLWVHPADMHGNEVAQRIAAAPIAEFLLARWPAIDGR